MVSHVSCRGGVPAGAGRKTGLPLCLPGGRVRRDRSGSRVTH